MERQNLRPPASLFSESAMPSSRRAQPRRPAPTPASRLHLVQRELAEAVFYPPHSPRTETSAYGTVHHRLVYEENRPCLICGVRQSTLHRREHNRFGASALETHHAVIEWSLSRAVDLGKFNAQVVAKLRSQHPEQQLYRRDFTRAQMQGWIDHHPDNLWVLCDVHHRHPGVGIHAISGPIWGAQALLRERYELGSPSTAALLRRALGRTE